MVSAAAAVVKFWKNQYFVAFLDYVEKRFQVKRGLNVAGSN